MILRGLHTAVVQHVSRGDSDSSWFLPLGFLFFFSFALTQEDFMKAVRKIAENKKLEGKVDYAKV